MTVHGPLDHVDGTGGSQRAAARRGVLTAHLLMPGTGPTLPTLNPPFTCFPPPLESSPRLTSSTSPGAARESNSWRNDGRGSVADPQVFFHRVLGMAFTSMPGYLWIAAISRSVSSRQFRLRRNSWYSLTTGQMIIVGGLVIFFSGTSGSYLPPKSFLWLTFRRRRQP